MSGLELATWLAVAVLVVGSAAVFVWFLVELVGEARRRREGRGRRGPDGGEAPGRGSRP